MNARGWTGIDDVDLEDAAPEGDGFAARFRTVAGRFEVRLVREASADAVRLTCHGEADEHPPAYRLLSIERL